MRATIVIVTRRVSEGRVGDIRRIVPCLLALRVSIIDIGLGINMHFSESIISLLSFFWLLSGGVALPLGVPPEEDPLVARVAPEKCLAYVGWAGMAKPDAATGNATEALMAEPEVQRILAEVDRRLSAAVLAAGEAEDDAEPSPAAALVEEGVPLGKLLLSRPVALFVESFAVGDAGPDIRGGALVNLGENAAKVKASLEKLQADFLEDAVEAVDVGGVPAARIKLGGPAPEITWAIKGKYLIVGVGPESLAGILARARTEPPAWLAQLRSQSGIERVSSVVRLDTAGVQRSLLPLVGRGARELTAILSATGLDDVATINVIAGLNETGFVSQTRLDLAGEAKGILTAVSDKPFSPLDLQPVPADATLAVAVRADAERIYTMMKEVIGNIDPGEDEDFERELRRVEEQTGVKIFEGIFKGLGDVWCAYNSSGEGGLIGTGLTACVTVRDHDKLKAEYDKIVKLIREQLERERGFRRGRGPHLKEIAFGEQTIHFITGERDFVVAPSFCLTEEYLVFALFPQNIKAFLSRGEDFQSLATSAHVGPKMKMDGGPSVIVYQDTQRLFKLLYPVVQMAASAASVEMAEEGFDMDISLFPSVKAIAPHLRPGLTTIARTDDAIVLESHSTVPGGLAGVAAPAVAAMVAPQIRQMRVNFRQTASMNNMKQIAIALHTYHDTHGHFPPAYTTDKDGKPLLSWRVQLLPYLADDGLMVKPRLDEPWDSEHNRRLLEEMPEAFRAPGSKLPAGHTVYLAPRGERTVFSSAKSDGEIERVKIAQIRDGSSNTIMVLEASDARAVPWTKPGDYAYDPKDPAAGLGQSKRGFNAAFADGSVRFIDNSIDREMLNLMYDRADGKPFRAP